MFYNYGNTFLTTLFNAFVIIERFDSSSLVLTVFLMRFNFLMCLCISFMALKMLKFSSSVLIIINTHSSSFSVAFCLYIS